MHWESHFIRTILGHISGQRETDKQLKFCALHLMSNNEVEHTLTVLGNVMDECHVHMRLASSPESLLEYRDSYINACILKSLALSMHSHSSDAIATVDHAFIIGGAGGDDDQSNILYEILAKLQASHPCPDDRSSEDLLCPEALDIFSPSSIPCLDPPPSLLAFQKHESKRPFILRGFATEWPALTTRCWNSLNYLRSVAGPGRVVPVEVGHDYRRDDWSQKLMPWDTFLQSLNRPGSPSSPIYLAQHNLLKQFPALRDDICVPDYVFMDIPGSANGSELTGDGVLFNIWLGPKGAMSPAHTDPYSNFYVQISGFKTVWLAPPSVTHTMSGAQKSTGLSNTSIIDVFADHLPGQHHDFISEVLPLSMMSVLHPGDMLFIPKGWWHAMRTESTSISLSMWF